MAGAGNHRLGTLVGWMRLAVGVSMMAAPARVLRLGSSERPAGDMTLMTRTVGVRDLVIGMGTVQGCRSRADAAGRQWIALGLCSDTLDLIIGVASARQVGRRGALIAALAPVPFMALGIAALMATE